MPNSVSLGGYTFTFVSGVCDPITNTQTLIYNVSFTTTPPPFPSPGISNFALALCDPDIHEVIAAFPNGDANTQLQPCFDTPPPGVQVPPQQVKFDVNNNEINSATGTNFTFILQGCFKLVDIDIALHAGMGQVCTFGKITGPDCNPAPPPPPIIRGISLDKIDTLA